MYSDTKVVEVGVECCSGVMDPEALFKVEIHCVILGGDSSQVTGRCVMTVAVQGRCKHSDLTDGAPRLGVLSVG